MSLPLDVDIKPGVGLGMFEIGSSLWTVLDVLRRLHNYFPQVDIKFDPDASCITPIILHIRPHIDLLFSGYHQRLHTICLRRLRDPEPPLILRYKDTVLSSREEILRRVVVSRTFGPTYPGDDLRYPGVWFSFEEDGMRDGLKSPVAAQHSEDRMQEVKRVLVSQKGIDGQERDALDEVLECPAMFGEVSKAIVKVHDGVVFHLHPASTKPVHVRLGKTTAQDLTLDIGSPSRVHYKEDDRMRIHSTSNPADEASDYFYNYFQHGVDFLVCGNKHVVKKIALHTNIPGSPLFQRYQRCPWELEAAPEDDEDDSPPRKRFYDRFEQISHFLSPREVPPSMLLDRTDEEDGITLPSSTTRLHGYDGIILEVTESSQVVAVMLF
ncbi:hypothetical protein PLICRDRAFT_33920 [Plicaturopsis crispa FD-325 SS-3]|nr:hypothetical protein PLICRDRAFT_33920 [Plicaturopsis crispa FD-325 SS-3]